MIQLHWSWAILSKIVLCWGSIIEGRVMGQLINIFTKALLDAKKLRGSFGRKYHWCRPWEGGLKNVR